MISVVIPLYNKEPIIERTLKSVLSQDYDDFEVVVVDDGSTDKSLSLAFSCREGTKVPMNVITQENGGPSKARNTGVKHAKGEWIVFLDADDELLPGALSHLAELVSSHKEVSFFCCPYEENHNNRTVQAYTYKNGFVSNNFRSHFFRKFLPHTGCALLSIDLARKYPFDERISRYEDFEQWFRIYRNEKIYLDSTTILRVNVGYAQASKSVRDITKDFIWYFDFKNKSFWEKMALYALYLSERDYYPNVIDTKYPKLKYRYDLLLLCNFLSKFKCKS